MDNAMSASTTAYELAGKRVWVAGHRGMAGSAITRRLASEDCEIVTADRATLDLTRQAAVEDWLAETKPQAVFLAAAKVGGIAANAARPAEFLYENLAIATNVIHAAWRTGVEKLLFLGSSCIYPREAPQPMTEDMLLTGPLEPTNEGYAVAKIAGMKLCETYRRQHGADFISCMPTNLFGPGDNFHPEDSHVVAGLLRRFHEAKRAGASETTVWGTGRPKREFLYVDDLADACVFLMRHYSNAGFVNVGTGREVSIAEFARLVADVVGYEGELVFDTSRPDGTPRKVMDVSRLTAMGWSAATPLRAGLEKEYRWFLENVADR